MEFKCTNSNGEIVLANKVNHVNLSMGRIVTIAFKNESYKLLFREDSIRLHEKQDCP